ncbi:unnamed protein product [Arabidopsis arenosa]|uniref:Uncharacterized protein n=1 Tax=Arabidopsis arenosa TaxID=38785 RepID=A0A8S2BC35_ARAAE|nr:unnamed protein product [Arabidopsis arenosa]
MAETRPPYLVFVFFFTLAVATQTTGSVKCKTGSLRYPFGFSDGYPIRFNCSEVTGETVIGEFAVQEVTNTNIYVKIPPVCEREIGKIEQLFQENFAPSKLQNIILVQECKEQSSNCLIRNKFVEDRLNISRCKSQVSCFNGTTTTTIADVMSIGDVVNGSGCKYWFSSISQSEVSVNLGRLKLHWWLKGSCSNITCSESADCANVKLADGGLGHRCTCREGFSGKAFTVPGGCHRLVRKRKGLHKLIVLGTAGILVGVLVIAVLIVTYIFRNKRSASSARTSIANRLLCELAGNSSFKVIDFTRPYTEVNLASLAVDRIGRGRVVDIIDPCLKTDIDPKMFASIQNLAELAFRCLSFHRNMRPTMIEITEDLQRIKLMYFALSPRTSKLDDHPHQCRRKCNSCLNTRSKILPHRSYSPSLCFLRFTISGKSWRISPRVGGGDANHGCIICAVVTRARFLS